MTVHIESFPFHGEAAVRVTTEKLEGIIVPGWGSNLVSLTWRPTGTALLRTPESAEAYHARTTLFGVPVLFPPNRIVGGRFTFQGREYRFPINNTAHQIHSHGVLMRTRWSLSKAEPDGDGAFVETTVASEEVPEIYAALPHKFTVRHQYRFSADAVDIAFVLESRDEAPMPWGLGYHTTFVMPLTTDGSLASCKLQVRADKAWTLSERLVPTGELTDNPYGPAMAEGMSLAGLELDDVLRAEPGVPVASVLTDETVGLRIAYTCDDIFKHWVMYNGKGKPDKGFFCPEPYTWVTNAPNLDLPADVTGLQVLEPGTTVAARTKIAVSAL
jgi:aldose 1-epimerase